MRCEARVDAALRATATALRLASLGPPTTLGPPTPLGPPRIRCRLQASAAQFDAFGRRALLGVHVDDDGCLGNGVGCLDDGWQLVVRMRPALFAGTLCLIWFFYFRFFFQFCLHIFLFSFF